MNIQLRDAKIGDMDFLLELKREGFKHYIDEIWGWDDKKQIEYIKEELNNKKVPVKIIVYNGENVGYCSAELRENGEFFMSNIAVLQKYRNLSIGVKLMLEQLKENDKAGIVTTLQVFKGNKAKSMYDKMGFVVYGETGTHFLMRRRPKSQCKQKIR